MIDHVFLWVQDIARSRAFYETSLEPLGWGEIGTYRSTLEVKDVPDLYGYGDASGASICYYAANVFDFDGNGIEFVHKS